MLSRSETARRPGERRVQWSDRLDDKPEIGPRPVLERLVGYGKCHPTKRWCLSPLPWHLGAHWVIGSEKQRWGYLPRLARDSVPDSFPGSYSSRSDAVL